MSSDPQSVASEEITDLAPDTVEKEILKLGPPRNGKIAKLPKELRDLVNGMLAERTTGSSVIAALAKYGVALNHENVSNWKHGGFQDWLIEQEWQAEVSVQREYPTGLDPDLPRPETRSFNNDANTPFSASRSFLKSAWSKLRLFTIACEELEQIASYVKIR